MARGIEVRFFSPNEIIEMAQEYFKTKLKEIKRIDLYAVKKVAVRKKDKDIDIGKHLLEPLLVLTIDSIQDGIRNISIRSNSIKKMVSEHLGNIPIQSIKVQKVDNRQLIMAELILPDSFYN